MKLTTPTTGPGVVLLGQVARRLPVIDVACSRCDRLGRLFTARLVADHDAYMPVPELLRPLSTDRPQAHCRPVARRVRHSLAAVDEFWGVSCVGMAAYSFSHPFCFASWMISVSSIRANPSWGECVPGPPSVLASLLP